MSDILNRKEKDRYGIIEAFVLGQLVMVEQEVGDEVEGMERFLNLSFFASFFLFNNLIKNLQKKKKRFRRGFAERINLTLKK